MSSVSGVGVQSCPGLVRASEVTAVPPASECPSRERLLES